MEWAHEVERYPRVGVPTHLGAVLLTFLDFGHGEHLQWSCWGHHLRVRKICSPCFCGQPRMEVTPEDRFLCCRICSRA